LKSLAFIQCDEIQQFMQRKNPEEKSLLEIISRLFCICLLQAMNRSDIKGSNCLRCREMRFLQSSLGSGLSGDFLRDGRN
jgi:hypothetical protein